MEQKTVRKESNMELLRILAMFMIVNYHIVCHTVNVQLTDAGSIARMGNGWFSSPTYYKRLIELVLLMPFGIVGNAVFVLISGYFLAVREKPVNIKKTAEKLLCQLGFASIVLLIMSLIVYKLLPGKSITLINADYFNNEAWFVGYYFFIILVAYLFLNRYLQKFSSTQYAAFLLAILALVEFGWSGGLLDDLANGLRTLGIGIFFYSFGGFIKKYDPLRHLKTWVLFLILILMNCIIVISNYNTTMNNIDTYNKEGQTGAFVQTINGFSNYSIVIVIMGICLFEIFRRIHMRCSKIINYLGSATFMVYLIHDNSFFYSLWGTRDWITLLRDNKWKFPSELLLYAICTFMFGTLMYAAYQGITALYHRIKSTENHSSDKQ